RERGATRVVSVSVTAHRRYPSTGEVSPWRPGHRAPGRRGFAARQLGRPHHSAVPEVLLRLAGSRAPVYSCADDIKPYGRLRGQPSPRSRATGSGLQPLGTCAVSTRQGAVRQAAQTTAAATSGSGHAAPTVVRPAIRLLSRTTPPRSSGGRPETGARRSSLV